MKYKIFNSDTEYEIEISNSQKFLYNTIIGRLILKLIYNRWISNIVGFFLNLRISKPLINKYIKKYNINMNLYKNKTYTSFNDFFKRELKEIPKTSSTKDFITPCDSKIMLYNIDKDLIINIKNSKYTLKELIKEEVPNTYEGGICLVYRLEPSNYHHYIFNDEGTITLNKKINGKLHTVNPIVYDKYQVFTENKREVSLLKTKNYGNIIQIEVGALCVGRIQNKRATTFNRYDEKGYFEFGGSTIIQLIEKDKVEINKEIIKNSQNNIETLVNIGTIIGSVKK